MHDRKYQDFDEFNPGPDPEVDAENSMFEPTRTVDLARTAATTPTSDPIDVELAAPTLPPPSTLGVPEPKLALDQASGPPASPEVPTFQTLLSGAVVVARYGAIAFGAWLTLMVILIAAYGWLTPPGSALMALRWMQGEKIDQRWIPFKKISPNLVRAVITSEDGRFCRHWGIDPKEIIAAIRRSRNGVPRGASTITMQLSKNLFLWPSKSYVRKVLEVPLTFAIELFWSKRRIMEVYLNVVEWGPGVFGAQAAARHHFRIPARKLSAYQASLLAVSLPNPITRRARAPSRHMERVARVVRARMKRNGYAVSCVLPRK